ncbi:SpoIIE family protein phosphatase [Streptomyces sp. NBC_01717]|uniref:SpoIIE family protein phosphatase n=1 Tax=Streptomyces sp. NBC_01717 TaxID=2975918 RepID=UPI002E318763|nr:SpoIIE family protein phosphatase [Streptomyces sp. NBC_01717]
MPDAAIAMLDGDGTVVGWTRTAQRLVGYSAREVVGRPAWCVMPLSRSMWQVQAFVEGCRARGGWSGTTAVRHRDGHMLRVGVRISLLWGLDGSVHWLVSGTDIAALSPVAISGSVRESLLVRTPIGIVVRDQELRCTWVNDVMERLDGVPHDWRLGRRLTDSLPGFESEALEAVMRQVLKSGTPTAHECRTWPLEDQPREHALAASFFCLHDGHGRPLGVCSVSVDVTGSRRAHERLAILSEASTRIGSSLDVMQTSQEMADLAVPLLADYAVVDLADFVPLGEAPAAHIRSTGECRQTFRRAGVASIHSGTPESPWARGESIFVPPTSPWIRVLASGSSHLEPVLDTSAGTWVGQDPARARSIRENGMHSMMLVPILARHAVLGVALFIRTENPEPFQEDDLLLAEELVTRAALSLDNARQYTREHTTALTLQRNLLPQHLRGSTTVEAASRYLPADADNGVGGDWFDVIPLSGARVALVVGDVVGHGINAAATMGILRTAVRTLADMDLSPDELLSHLDDTVRRQAEEDPDAADAAMAAVGATCVYAVYDPVHQQCTMARAGHPPPAIVDPQGKVTFPDLPTGAPLGVGSVPFETVTVELPDGALLALYTDGLVEARERDIDIGIRQLGSTLADQPHRPLEALCSAVIEALPTQSPSDDVTLLVARTRSPNPVQTVSWDLPRDPAVVGRARGLVTRQLTGWGLQDLAMDTELIASELVTNAIRHGVGPVSLRLIKHRLLTCEVSDVGKSFPRLRHTCSSDETGRGILLVSQLSRRWGSRLTTGGKVVWAEQDLPRQG